MARRRLAAFAASVSGNIGIITAIALPVVAVAAVGGVQIAAVSDIRAKTQSIADAAALMGAEQLSVTPAGATARAQSWAQGQLASLLGSTQTTYQAVASLPDASHVQVAITTSTPSYFGPSLPVGGFQTSVAATAESVTQWPLCLLVTAPPALPLAGLALIGKSSISANCEVYSDGGIAITGAAKITDGATQVVQSIVGPTSNIGPAAPMTGAPAVSDPFTAMSYLGPTGQGSSPSPCLSTSPMTVSGTTTLQPGRYCASVSIATNAVVTMASGEYEFDGTFQALPGSTVSGADVLLFFAPGSALDLQTGSTVSLAGRQTGPHAGFVITTTHKAADLWRYPLFVIQSDPLAKVTGTVYSPIVPLRFEGSSTAAQASDWTVIVASSVLLAPSSGSNAPTLQLNANYSASVVPVPTGVGNTIGGTRLVN